MVTRVTCHVSPAEAEQDPGPERLVIEPGRVLVDLHVGAQQQRHPLGEARSTRAVKTVSGAQHSKLTAAPDAVARVQDEAGPEPGQDRQLREHLTTLPRPL